MKTIKNITLGLSLLLCFFIGSNTAAALTISPVKIEVTGEPGQTLQGELELLNEQPEVKTFFSSFENFEPAGDTGSPKFVCGADGLATWIGTAPSVMAGTGETVKVPFSITIPSDAEAGGYFAAIFWGEQDPKIEAAGEVAIGGKLGVLILLRVAGDIAEEAGISEFSIVDDGFLVTDLPVAFSYRFTNSGGDRVVPLGDIEVKNMFGSIAATVNANTNEGSVLPSSARKFTPTWGEVAPADAPTGFFTSAKQQLADFHFGLYKANLTLVYGATNQTVQDSIWFVMLPWQLLSLAGLTVLLLLFILKKYNAWIIAKSKSNS